MSNPRQFRSVGPMAVREDSLKHLRQLVGACHKVKYLALYKEGQDMMLLAQGIDKLSPAVWRDVLKVEHVAPSASLRQAIEAARDKGLEEFGSYSRHHAGSEHAKSGGQGVTQAMLVAHRVFLSTSRLLDEQRQRCLACEAKRRRL
jgi:hypothetical protein